MEARPPDTHILPSFPELLLVAKAVVRNPRAVARFTVQRIKSLILSRFLR
jgi:hypothetical protein